MIIKLGGQLYRSLHLFTHSTLLIKLFSRRRIVSSTNRRHIDAILLELKEFVLVLDTGYFNESVEIIGSLRMLNAFLLCLIGGFSALLSVMFEGLGALGLSALISASAHLLG
jgi:hypothetical protein